MRSKRNRQAVKQADEYVDLDSDEFEQALAGEDSLPHASKKPKCSSSCKQQPVPDAQPGVAAAAAASPNSKQDYQLEASNQPEEHEVLHLTDDDDEGDAILDEYTDSVLQYSMTDNSSDAGSFSADDESDDSRASKGRKSSKLQAKGKQAQKAKKRRKKRQSTRRLCATYAKSEYKLTDNDLKQLTDIEYRENPHYPGGYPMKLYLVRELEELARKKQERKAREAETKEERAAARALDARARKAEAAAKAAEAASKFDAKAPKEGGHGSVALPDTCLAKIMSCLASTLQPGGLRGPSAAAKDLAQASLVCWDFFHAAKAGFVALGEATAGLQQLAPPACERPHPVIKLLRGIHALPGPDSLGGWPFWDELLQHPTNLKLPQIKEAARHLGLQVTGTKAELMLRILGAFGFTAPTTVPAQLLRALLLERSQEHDAWDGPAAAAVGASVLNAIRSMMLCQHPAGAVVQAARGSRGVAGMRAAIIKSGFSSFEAFRTAAEVALQKQRRKWKEEQQRAKQRWQEQQQATLAMRQLQQGHAPPGVQPSVGQQGRAALYPVPGAQPVRGMPCRCGNAAALACSRGCCGLCCSQLAGMPGAGRCARHHT